MIIILKGDYGNIDFASPIKLSDNERKKFLEFLRKRFYSVREEEVSTFRFERLGDKSFSKEWEEEEFQILLNLEMDNEEASKLLGRSWMSVEMKRMYYIPEMMEYAEKKGVNLFKASKSELKNLISDYMKEHENEIKKRRDERIEERREIKQARGFIENYDKRVNEKKFLISIGRAKKEDLEALKKEKKEAEDKLREMEEE
jgi:molecular chaperone DnaK (HSP70)